MNAECELVRFNSRCRDDSDGDAGNSCMPRRTPPCMRFVLPPSLTCGRPPLFTRRGAMTPRLDRPWQKKVIHNNMSRQLVMRTAAAALKPNGAGARSANLKLVPCEGSSQTVQGQTALPTTKTPSGRSRAIGIQGGFNI